MDFSSDSDSGASHVSATPPRHPLPRSSLNPKPKPISIPKSKPKPISVPRSNPKPPNPLPSDEPSLSFPCFNTLDGLSFKIQRQVASDTHRTTSFSSLVRSRRPSFDPADLESAVSSLPPMKPAPSDRVKPAKLYPNWIPTSASPEPAAKRHRFSSEGNFVRLNINGYGRRKYPYKSGKKKFSRRSFRRRGKPGHEAGEGDGIEMSGLEEKSLNCDLETVEEAVAAVREEPNDGNLVGILKLVCGFDSFREGQLEVIKKVIAGESTMLVLPTGAGKSLCYQLPALILPGVTLVVSPLVALMVDQLKRLPPVIPGGLLSSNQTSEESSATLQKLMEEKIKVLFVSPERFLNPEFLSIFEDGLTVSLVVVDEAHCISEWSHNFRPSYMRLRVSQLRAKLNVRCVLAMTATATSQTLHEIISALEIPSNNLIQTCQIRENLQLSVSSSGNRLKDLLMLMKSSPFVGKKNIIVYCKFQAETEMVSKYLSDNNIPAKGYHSGIPARDRNKIQELFCSNKLRVVVATVAFGMGLDKSDVDAVIHYSMPESLEEYIQETGRAGRDGRLSFCHLLLDDTSYYKLRSLSHSNGIDEYLTSKLLHEIFSNDIDGGGHVYSLIKESASRKFDMKEEVLLTILTQLELCDEQYLRLLPQLNVTCTMYFHKTSPALLSDKDILVETIMKKSERKQGHFVFNIPSVVNNLGITTTDLQNRLQKLKALGEITYDLKDPAFCFSIIKKPDDYCFLTSKLTRWLSEVERCKVQKLEEMFHVATFAAKECQRMDGCSGNIHTPCIQKKVSDYFFRDSNAPSNDFCTKMGQTSPFLRADIKVFLQSNSHVKFTPRAVARIMHGIPSPAFPSATWSKCHFWERYSNIDFSVVMQAATVELMNFVSKGDSKK